MEISFHRGYSFIFALHFVCVFTEIREYMEIGRQVYSMRSYIAYLLYRLQSQSHPLEGVVVAVEVVAVSEFTKNNIVVILRNCGV